MSDIDTLPIQIIELSARKWQEYRQLRLDALKESPQAFSSRYEEQVNRPDEFWKSRLEEAAKGGSSWLLFARSGEKLVGMVGAARDPVNGLEAEIISMYVLPEARGRGVAGLLMHAILMVLKESGICKACLTVNLDQAPAVHVYKKFGFDITQVDTVVMGDGAAYNEAVMEKIME
jgi:ribosomal protein S18 acetylase RimI-like enzyme